MATYMGYKGFEFSNGKLQYRGREYPIGQTVVHDGPLEFGWHSLQYCPDISDVFLYYSSNGYHRYARVSSTDPGVTDDDYGDRISTRNLTVIELLNGLVDGYHFKEGQLHRLDGPAIEYSNGGQEWYQDGRLHRLDGPAIIVPGHSKEWYQNGERHRDDGPAVECSNGRNTWYRHGLLHRDDGPAFECLDNSKNWYRNGLRHRLGGPAIEYPDGRKEWYQDGLRHRLDGPAIEYPDGRKEWYLEGRQYPLNEWPIVAMH